MIRETLKIRFSWVMLRPMVQIRFDETDPQLTDKRNMAIPGNTWKFRLVRGRGCVTWAWFEFQRKGKQFFFGRHAPSFFYLLVVSSHFYKRIYDIVELSLAGCLPSKIIMQPDQVSAAECPFLAINPICRITLT